MEFLNQSLAFFEHHFDSPALVVTAGIFGTTDSVVPFERHWARRYSDRYYEEFIAYRMVIERYADTGHLGDFFTYLWGCYGLERPAE